MPVLAAAGVRLAFVALVLHQTPSWPWPWAEKPLWTCSEKEYVEAQMKVVDACKVPVRTCVKRMFCGKAQRFATDLFACYRAKDSLVLQCRPDRLDSQRAEAAALLREQDACAEILRDHLCRVGTPDDEVNAIQPKDPKPPPDIYPLAPQLLPPGECTQMLFRQLTSRVAEYCQREPMSCDGPEQRCEKLSVHFQRFTACINAHRLLMETCFRGGNESQRTVVAQLLEGQAVCEKQRQERCVPDTH